MTNWQLPVTAALGIGTILLGIWEFNADSKLRAKSAGFEARKPFLVKQMELCFQASEAAATLASTTDREKWQAARETFWVLFWGPLSIVENQIGTDQGPVELQMVAIGNKLLPLQANPSLPASDLEQLSLDLAHRCRDLIFGSWEIKRGG